MNREIIDKIRNKTYALGTTDKDIINYIQMDYDDLIDLRNRLSNDTTYPNNNEIYEEDYLLLDRVLDYIEILKEI